MRRVLTALVLAALASVAAAPASARTIATKTGRITAFFFSPPGGASFRVTLDTPLTECTGNFAFIDTSFGNYKAYVSGLLFAQSQNKAINLVYNIKNDGYCEILEYGYYI